MARLLAAVAGVLGEAGLVHVGVADGLFASLLAARSRTIVPRGEAAAFLAPWSVAVLGRPELAVTFQRLGIHTLGQFAALPRSHVLARFGGDAAACHRVAAGSEGELPGLRDTRVHHRLRVAAGGAAEVPRQPGFFGGVSGADERAASSFARLQQRLGVEAVLVGRLQGGRTPAERARLVPWGSPGAGTVTGPTNAGTGTPGGARTPGGTGTVPPGPVPAATAPPDRDPGGPWPGRLPAPSPATVLGVPVPVEVVDAQGRPLRVSGNALLSAEPWRVSIGGGSWQQVRAWAGPWPIADRWWAARRRRAHLQVVTGSGAAVLLMVERGRWWLEAVYD